MATAKVIWSNFLLLWHMAAHTRLHNERAHEGTTQARRRPFCACSGDLSLCVLPYAIIICQLARKYIFLKSKWALHQMF